MSAARTCAIGGTADGAVVIPVLATQAVSFPPAWDAIRVMFVLSLLEAVCSASCSRTAIRADRPGGLRRVAFKIALRVIKRGTQQPTKTLVRRVAVAGRWPGPVFGNVPRASVLAPRWPYGSLLMSCLVRRRERLVRAGHSCGE
jgi:hypothetical protein